MKHWSWVGWTWTKGFPSQPIQSLSNAVVGIVIQRHPAALVSISLLFHLPPLPSLSCFLSWGLLHPSWPFLLFFPALLSPCFIGVKPLVPDRAIFTELPELSGKFPQNSSLWRYSTLGLELKSLSKEVPWMVTEVTRFGGQYAFPDTKSFWKGQAGLWTY